MVRRTGSLAIALAGFLVAACAPSGEDSDPSIVRLGDPGGDRVPVAGGDPDLRSRVPAKRPQRFGPARPERPLTAAEAERLARVMALPYLQGTVEAPSEANVIRIDRDRVEPGYRLYTSGHAPEALMIDVDGEGLHRWAFDIGRVWPDAVGAVETEYWRRAHWYPNGDVLFIFEGIGLVKIDARSELLWAQRNGAHHQVAVSADGTIYALTRRPRVVPVLHPTEPILEDFVTVLSPGGELLAEHSVLALVANSPFAPALMPLVEGKSGDIFHTNSIEVLDGSQVARSDVFAAGNVLLSIREIDALAIADLRAEKVVWAIGGPAQPFWRAQHDPRLLPSGQILLFDNKGRGGRSRAIEFDPLRLGITWAYPAEPDADFLSLTCGTAERLPNGNTILTESDLGRAIEVTATGEIVWEFLNPNRAGAHGELIATLFEMKHVPLDFPRWSLDPAAGAARSVPAE